MKRYRGISGLLIMALLISVFSGTVRAGAPAAEEDPLNGRAGGQVLEGFYNPEEEERKSAGTAYGKAAAVPKREKLTVLYQTKDKSNKTWYKVKYTGYIPASGTKKL